MNSLAAAHPRVYEEFMSGGHAFMSGQTWRSSNRSMPTLKEREASLAYLRPPLPLIDGSWQHVNVRLHTVGAKADVWPTIQ